MTGLTKTYLACFLLLLAAGGWVLQDAARAHDAVRTWPDRPGPALSVSYLEHAAPGEDPGAAPHPGLRPLVYLDFVHAP